MLDQALRARGARLDRDWFDARTGVSTREMVALVAAELGVDLDTRRAAAAAAAWMDAVDVRPLRPGGQARTATTSR